MGKNCMARKRGIRTAVSQQESYGIVRKRYVEFQKREEFYQSALSELDEVLEKVVVC